MTPREKNLGYFSTVFTFSPLITSSRVSFRKFGFHITTSTKKSCVSLPEFLRFISTRTKKSCVSLSEFLRFTSTPTIFSLVFDYIILYFPIYIPYIYCFCSACCLMNSMKKSHESWWIIVSTRSHYIISQPNWSHMHWFYASWLR